MRPRRLTLLLFSKMPVSQPETRDGQPCSLSRHVRYLETDTVTA